MTPENCTTDQQKLDSSHYVYICETKPDALEAIKNHYEKTIERLQKEEEDEEEEHQNNELD